MDKNMGPSSRPSLKHAKEGKKQAPLNSGKSPKECQPICQPGLYSEVIEAAVQRLQYFPDRRSIWTTGRTRSNLCKTVVSMGRLRRADRCLHESFEQKRGDHQKSG